MSKGFRILVSIGAVCAILGLVLSAAGFCIGGRLTNIHVYWDHGPRVRYIDAFEDGDFGVGIFDSVEPIDPPDAPDAPDAPDPSFASDMGSLDAPSAEIQELDIDLGAAKVVLQIGNGYEIQVKNERSGGDWRVHSEYSDDEWHIYSTGSWNSVGTQELPTVRITVPEGTVFDEVSLSIGAGSLTSDALRCDEAEIHVGAGNMTLGAVDCQKAKVSVGAGTMTWDALRCGEAEIHVGAGTLTLDELSCRDDCDIDVGIGTLRADSGALERETEISCGMGSVRLNLERPARYGYTVNGGMGSVSIDGSKYSGMAIDTTQNPGAPVFYAVKCGMGSVTVEFTD